MFQRSLKKKKWQIKDITLKTVNEISEAHGISKILSSLLAGRGITTKDDVDYFLHPQLSQLPSPFLLKGVNEAVQVIHEAMNKNLNILLYGDYDVDGVTAVSVLANFLKSLNKPYIICHPDRFEDGYGLKASVVDRNAGNLEPGLIITCDLGISDEIEVGKLRSMGWKIIITDHHQPPDVLPNANAIVNPWQKGCQFPFKDLAGAGVSFFLIMALRRFLVEYGVWTTDTAPNLKALLDIVAIGTICDMVDIKGVNRILVKAGLDVIPVTRNLGLARMMEQCGIANHNQISSDDISFKLGPRLNAAGRMGKAELSSRLLTTEDSENAQKCIEQIEAMNTTRRELTFSNIDQAFQIVKEQELTQKPCIIVYRKDWHLGVIGIVASKLLEQYNLPAVVLCGDGALKGSVRSVDGINFHDLLADCSDLLIEYGGHSAACGFSVKIDNLNSLKQKIYELILSKEPITTESQLIIDHCFTADEWVTEEVAEANSYIHPYGFNNNEPIYTVNSACELRNIQFIGKEKSHIRFQAKLNGNYINCVGFGFADAFQKNSSFSKDCTVKAKLAFSLRNNTYNSRETKQLFLHDLMLDSKETQQGR